MSNTGSTPSKWLSNNPKSSPTPPKPSTPTSNRINPSTHLSPRATVKLPTTVPGGTTASLVFYESVLHLRLEAMKAGNHGIVICSENEEGELKAKAHSGYPKPERITGPWFETAITGFETTHENFQDRICWERSP
ncbi:hypothetical protein MMC08_000641 [Hypocenomyce scalaris]|nr:hypothetical protein [Hypocenomyce scalaris]